MRERWIAIAMVAACGGGGSETADAPPADAPPPPPDAGTPIDSADCLMDGVGEGNGGFVRPTQVSRAWQETAPGSWMELGAADWSCAPLRLITTRGAGALGGRVLDFQTGSSVPNAGVEAFVDGDFTSPDMSVTANAQGNYTLDLPTATDLAFRITATDHVPTYHVAPPPGTTDLDALGNATRAALPALVGITSNGGPIAIGAVADCAGKRVSDVVVTVSVQPDCVTHGPGALTFYFGLNGLPVRNTQQPVSTANGLYMVLLDAVQVQGQVQVWGFATGDDPVVSPMRLLATRTVDLAPGTATLVAVPIF